MKNDTNLRQFLYRNPFAVTLVLALGTFWCSFTINGIYNVAVENIMRRYELSATYMSSIVACYGIIQCFLVIPISYRFGRKWKAKVIGSGMIIFSIGCFCFTLPHVLSERYKPIVLSECNGDCEPKLHSVRYFFNFAYLLLGLGNVPMYTLTLSYIHENNYFGKVGTNHHYAWYHMNTAFGPGIGFLIAGQFTKTWVDFYDKNMREPDDLDIESKLWVGTWWISYWISGLFTFLLGIFVILFVPEKLKTRDRQKDDYKVKPEKKQSNSPRSSDRLLSLRQSRSDYQVYLSKSQHSTRTQPSYGSALKVCRSESHATAVSGTSYQEIFDNPSDLGEGHDWSDILPSYKKLLSNNVFLSIMGTTICDMAYISVVSMYGLIYLSEIYNISQDTASMIFSASLATVMLALPGSSFATRKVDVSTKSDVKWTMKMLRFLTFLGACSCLSLFFMCDDNHHLYAGGNKNFNEISGIKGNWITNPTYENIDGFNPELFGTCSNDGNRECKCSPQEYSPVCANLTVTTELNVTSSEQVTFFSPCHLGCEFDLDEENPFKSLKKRQVGETDSPIVKNCKCIDMEFTNVEFGSCAKYACDWRIYLIIPGLVFGCFLTFFQAVPGTLVTQAIVPDHLRSAALGLNALFYRIFGTIPVPILAAKVIDSKCLWWSTTCQREKGACRAFDKYGLSAAFVTIIFVLKCLALLSYTFGIYHVDKLSHLKQKGATKTDQIAKRSSRPGH